MDRFKYFEIKCKQCGNVMEVFNGHDYSTADNKITMELFSNTDFGVTIRCDVCKDNGYKDCNIISVSEPTVIFVEGE